MNKSITIICALSFLLTACGRPQNLGEGPERHFYQTYGLFNASPWKSNDVCYTVSIGNVVLSLLFIETVVAPVYFVGFDLFNPVRMKRDVNDDCSAYD